MYGDHTKLQKRTIIPIDLRSDNKQRSKILSVMLTMFIVLAGACPGQDAAADAGVSVKDGQTMSFDANGKLISETEAYWHGHPGKLYTAAFSEKGSEDATVVVQFQGGINWTKNSITTDSDFAVKATKTSTAGVAWLPVKSFKVDKEALVVVTGDGETIRLHDFDIHFAGKVDRNTERPAAKDVASPAVKDAGAVGASATETTTHRSMFWLVGGIAGLVALVILFLAKPKPTTDNSK